MSQNGTERTASAPGQKNRAMRTIHSIDWSFNTSWNAPRQDRWMLALVAIVAAVLQVGPIKAASSSKKQSGDSAPVLMSKTGGGDMWADLKELQQAAAKGNPKAEVQLGEMLLRGDGIVKDERRGIVLIEKAARAGNSAAAFRVGMLLMNGQSGVANDPVRAHAYFRAAAAGGEKEAFFNIGAAYGSARGVKRDYGEALGWLIVARNRGADPKAEKTLREQIKAQPSWIAKGERRAKEIEREFTGKKVIEFLPPVAPLEFAATPVKLAEDLKPADSLRPPTRTEPPGSLKPASDSLRPSLPALPPPSIRP